MLARLRWFSVLVSFGLLLSLGACERKQRARDRDAAKAKAEALRPRPATRRPPAPLAEEPPFGPLRVESSGLPCAVDDAFGAKCRRCHTIPTRHGAPFVFLTWDDTQQLRNGQPLHQLIGRAVKSGFMPYKIATNPEVLPLTEVEKQTILDWVETGAPREDCDPFPGLGGNGSAARGLRSVGGFREETQSQAQNVPQRVVQARAEQQRYEVNGRGKVAGRCDGTA